MSTTSQLLSATDPPTTNEAGNLLSVIPRWFLVILGVVYSSGFLVVLTFLDTFGVSPSSAEFWRGKYIHIGVLCVAFPLMVNGTIYPFWYIYRSRKLRITQAEPNGHECHVPRLRRILAVMALYLNFEFLFYVFVMFTRPAADAPHDPIGMWWLLAVLMVTLCVFIVTFLEELHRRLAQFVGSKWPWPNSWDKQTVLLRWGLVCVALVFDVLFFLQYDMLLELVEYHWRGLAIYFALVLVVGFFPWKMYWFITRPMGRSRTPLIGRERVAAWILIGCILTPLCYLMLVPFSHSVFLYIPATRGGGDYTTSAGVTIDLKHQSVPSGPGATKEMVLIEETSTGVYVANPDDAGGPKEWRKCRINRPDVHFYGYDCISHIRYAQRKLDATPK